MPVQKQPGAIFLDRDGTINVDKKYVFRTEEMEFLPGAIDGLKMLLSTGFRLFVVTNQSGVARGYFPEQAVIDFHSEMSRRLAKYGVKIDDYRYCPHLPEGIIDKYRLACECRKPGSTLFSDIASEHGVDISKSFAIGDRLRDVRPMIDLGGTGIVLGDMDDTGLRYEGYRATGLCAAAELVLSLVDTWSADSDDERT